jgi:hypothetical protein
MKSLRYIMWNDSSREFADSISRMLKLGYKLEIIAYQREYQQNQKIGNTQKS